MYPPFKSLSGKQKYLTLLTDLYILLSTLQAGPNLDLGVMGAFFRANVLKKGHFVCLHPLNRCHFTQPISNENIFFKTQGTRLGAIVTPNKGLE